MGAQNFYSVIAVVVSALLTGVITYATARAASRRSEREKAGQTEITVRAQFVIDLTKRIKDLEERIDSAAKRERELNDRCASDMESLDARWRHLTNNLVMHSQLLIFRMRRASIDVPEFKGWDQFSAEGGTVRPEWAESWEPSPRPSTEKKGEDDSGGT